MTENYIDHFLNHVLPELRIAVIGDIMVDRYVFGKVERISPEAPVPVNKVDHMTSVLGGAANVASNLANLDCHVFLAASSATMKTRLSCTSCWKTPISTGRAWSCARTTRRRRKCASSAPASRWYAWILKK